MNISKIKKELSQEQQKEIIGILKARFDKNIKTDLLCGTDGLPHLIADGRWSHSAEFITPGFIFIYIDYK